MRNNGLGATDVEEVDQNGDKSRTFIEDDIAYILCHGDGAESDFIFLMTLMISLAVNGLQSIGAEGVGIHGGWTWARIVYTPQRRTHELPPH